MKRWMTALLALGFLATPLLPTHAAEDKKSDKPATKKADDKKADANNKKQAPTKCQATHKKLKAEKLHLANATKTYKACRTKYKRTHLLRCRKEKKVMDKVKKLIVKAIDNHNVCMMGCAWLQKVANKNRTLYKRCRKKHKWTHLVRCRTPKNKTISYDKQFATCQRFRKKKK